MSIAVYHSVLLGSVWTSFSRYMLDNGKSSSLALLLFCWMQAAARRRSVAWHQDAGGAVRCEVKEMPPWYLENIKHQCDADVIDLVVRQQEA